MSGIRTSLASAPLAGGHLPHADIVDLHPLRQGSVVHSLLARPVAAHREVQDDPERRIEGPGALAARLVVEDAQNALAIDADADRVRPPVELVDVEISQLVGTGFCALRCVFFIWLNSKVWSDA